MRKTDWKVKIDKINKMILTARQIVWQPKRIAPVGAILFGCFLVLLSRMELPQTAPAPEALAEEQTEKETGYVAFVNGEEVGMATSSASIQDAYLEAKAKVYDESGDITENELRIVELEVPNGMLMDYSQLQDNMYQAIKGTVDTTVYVYKVTVGDRSFAFDSKEDIEKFFGDYAAPYNQDGLFTAVVTETQHGSEAENLFAFVDSAKAERIRETGIFGPKDRVVTVDDVSYELGFSKEVEITKCVEGTVRVVTVENASKLLADPETSHLTYHVESGDSLSSIADSFDLTISELLEMNPDVSYDSILSVGQEFIVQDEIRFLAAELTVIETETEQIPYETEKVENSEWSEAKRVVVSEGVSGEKTVTYKIVYRDGQPQKKELIEETVTKAPVAEVIEVGTIRNATYIKPLVGGIFFSAFGVIDDGRTNPHHGVDWACPVGTTIFASKSGTVITSEYDPGDYGYYIEILHDDGFVTRYAHMNELVAQVGDYVAQGETIGYSGETGFVTGPHIHLEIVVGGVSVDPEIYLVSID